MWIGTSSLAANDADRVTSDLCSSQLTKFAQLIQAAWHWRTFNLMMPVPHIQENHVYHQESHQGKKNKTKQKTPKAHT